MSSHPFCRRHHTKYVNHRRWHMYAIMSIIHDIISTLMTTALSIYDITFTLFVTSHAHDVSSTEYDITITICVTSHNACVSDNTHSMFMTFPLYMASHRVFWQCNHCVTSQPLCLISHPLYLGHHTHSINFIKPSVCMTSQPLYVWHHVHYIWHHIHSLGHHTTLCMTSGPLYLTSLPLYLCHHTRPIDNITATICMTSHPVYLWHHIHYIYDIISTKCDITTLCVDDATLGICMTSFALQMTTHPLYHTKPQYLWCHIHFRYDITPSVSDIVPTLSFSSQPLLCYHTHFFMT